MNGMTCIRTSPRLRVTCIALIAALYSSGFVLLWKTERPLGAEPSPAGTSQSSAAREQNAIERRIRAQAPKGLHIVVDTSRNVLLLKRGEQTLREALVSTGSGSILEEPGGNRRWVFDTPRGEFTVRSKVRDPIWIKPDWAFIEEGEEIPRNPADRAERGVLGDYALGIGNGYFIHGTLYTRMLGRNITHGCIRVNDDDLKSVYQAVSIGTPVFIF